MADHDCEHYSSAPTSPSTSDTSAQSIIVPPFPAAAAPEPPEVQATIKALSLVPHIEGGYYVLTDSSPTLIPSPYPPSPLSEQTLALVGGLRPGFDPAFRSLSSSIFYYLTPARPTGSFHRNRSRIVHTWHRGRGCYILIYPDGRVESFIVGSDVERGEKLQWAVEGGVWKASYLLGPSDADSSHNEGLLISETVVPGFEYADHEFLSRQRCAEILSENLLQELGWLVKH
ncbi:cupin superfamily protein [Hirsutella rhossiliensis]|uniref:Cupin superfamily protein n=1 Tax=Hirsutella rhossiliensis TaxID=111463 RepID=A0A9P8MZC6_9HYPO|nr:cupin superfamily protein [Hirsutella rhossiliensis]KAH0963772.1 cupin superfamily protein [Hirsutella rhossiliensis]